VAIPCGAVELRGLLSLAPGDGAGLVVFAHGSGSSRNSPRNLFVADHLRRAGLGSLLFDRLTEEEEAVDLRTRHLRFDIPRLAHRLELVTRWLMRRPPTVTAPTLLIVGTETQCTSRTAGLPQSCGVFAGWRLAGSRSTRHFSPGSLTNSVGA
jgi:hypothetical protein